MFLITLGRIIKSGFNNFKRNGVVSLASVLIVSVTLIIGLSLLFFQAILSNTLEEVRDKVDVTIYFVNNTESDKILETKEEIENLPEVENVTYVSSEEALIAFKERHKDDYLTIQALEELGENPLGASLNIKAKEPSQYEGIARFIENDPLLNNGESKIIDRVNYQQNKVAIDRLAMVTDGVERLGFLIVILFIVISIIITFNTIRLTIFIAKDEITVMSLVGASRAHIRGPFAVEGVIYGVLASVLSMIIYLPISYALGKNMTGFLGINIYEYYLSNFFSLFFIILVAGIVIGVFSSILAIRKYLNN